MVRDELGELGDGAHVPPGRMFARRNFELGFCLVLHGSECSFNAGQVRYARLSCRSRHRARHAAAARRRRKRRRGSVPRFETGW